MSEPFLGEVRMFSSNFPPKGWAFCDGQLLPVNQNQALFSILGPTYGGDGRTTFALPNLRSRAPLHMGDRSPLGETRSLGAGQPSAGPGYLAIVFCIALVGIYPSRS